MRELISKIYVKRIRPILIKIRDYIYWDYGIMIRKVHLINAYITAHNALQYVLLALGIIILILSGIAYVGSMLALILVYPGLMLLYNSICILVLLFVLQRRGKYDKFRSL